VSVDEIQGNRVHVATEDLMIAANAAVTLERMLLIKGCWG
jgi:hypothetical protein